MTADPAPDADIRLLSVAEVMAQTGLNEYQVRRAITAGLIPHHRFGRIIRVPRAALEDFVAQLVARSGT